MFSPRSPIRGPGCSLEKCSLEKPTSEEDGPHPADGSQRLILKAARKQAVTRGVRQDGMRRFRREWNRQPWIGSGTGHIRCTARESKAVNRPPSRGYATDPPIRWQAAANWGFAHPRPTPRNPCWARSEGHAMVANDDQTTATAGPPHPGRGRSMIRPGTRSPPCPASASGLAATGSQKSAHRPNSASDDQIRLHRRRVASLYR